MTLTIAQITLLSWALQCAMAVILLFAMTGVVLTFGRPAMRALALGWLAFTLLTFDGLLSTVVNTGATTNVWVSSVAAAGIVCILMLAPVWAHAADVLAGVDRSAWPPARRTVPWLVVAGCLFAAILVTVQTELLSARTAFFAQPFAIVVVASWLTWRSWSRARAGGDGANTRLLALLTVAFALIPVRVLVSLLVRGSVDTTTVEQTAARIGVLALWQVLHSLVGGVILIVVALGEERSAVIEQETRLRDAEARLLDSRRFESLGRLASGVAHDFNNVLTVLIGGVDSVRTLVRVTPEVATELTMVEEAIRRASDLIRQLTTYARRQNQTATQCDVAAGLRGSVDLMRRLAGGQVQVDVDVPGDGMLVAVDPTRFDQVLMNLVVNARDAMPNGGRLSIALVEERRPASRGLDGAHLPAGRFVRLSVADTGGGIPADVVPHIFEPFFSTKGESRGSGLGLATVQRIAREAGGDVLVATTLGKGTRFDVVLPLARRVSAEMNAVA